MEALNTIESAAFAALLLAFGVANFLGTAVAGPLADRRPRAGVLVFSLSLGTGMLLMLTTGTSVVGVIVTIANVAITIGALGACVSEADGGADSVPRAGRALTGSVYDARDPSVSKGSRAIQLRGDGGI